MAQGPARLRGAAATEGQGRLLPGGRQVELRFGDQEAQLTQVGATLRQYRVDGVELLDGFGPEERSLDGRGQLLVPWPNRIQGGRYRFQGRSHQLPLSEPEAGNAIHGLVRWANWSLESASQDRASLGLQLHPQPGYDFSLELKVEVSLGPDGLRHQLRATNVGGGPLPFGAGAHPYLRLAGSELDDWWLRAPATAYLDSDPRGIPRGRPLAVAGTGLDFRSSRPLRGLRLDTAFTGLELEEGRVEVELSSPLSERSVRLWADHQHRFLMLFTGDSLPNPTRRRRGLAVEPMTCAPNAFRSGRGLLVLEPGESYSGSWGLSRR